MSAAGHTGVAERFAEAMVRGDERELRALYAPDLRFVVHPDGIERDREGALAAFRAVRPLLRDLVLRVVERRVTADGYVQRQVLRFRTPDGAPASLPVRLAVRVRDGRITRVDEHVDPALVRAILARTGTGE